MDNITIKDSRVFSSQLDLKNNEGRTLLEKLEQLQTGSVLKGMVVGNTSKGEIIFSTLQGKFTAPNSIGLNKGDKIIIKLTLHNEQIRGTVITVNNKPTTNLEPLSFKLITLEKTEISNITSNTTSYSINLNDSANMPKNISGAITYLNLSKINNESLLFRMLDNLNNTNLKIPITLNVMTNNKNISSPYQIVGEVNSNNKMGPQLIKTNFGIITTENTRLAAGQKLILEITSLNKHLISNNMTNYIAGIMYKIRENWPFLKELAASKSKTNEKKSTQLVNKTGPETQSINNILSALGKKDLLKELTTEFKLIKEFLAYSISDERKNGTEWQSIMVPFYTGTEVEEKEIKINIIQKNYLRFIFNSQLNHAGIVQFDGLIRFEEYNRSIQDFSLTMRSNPALGMESQKKISQIFRLNQNITGIQGSLTFEETSNLPLT